MRKFQDRVAVVTGAASGIGRAVSLALAEEGCHLALVDRDEAGLAAVSAQVAARQRHASTHNVNVADRTAMERLPNAVVAAHGGAHMLINNAGVALAGQFEELGLDDLEWIFAINFWGFVYGCKFFLPHLRRVDEAHIVNVASDFALFGLPTKSGYCATKFAIRGFSESLRAELYGSSVGLSCVYPGAVATNLIRAGRAADAGKREREAAFVESRAIPADRVAAQVIRGIRHNQGRVLIGRDTWMIELLSRLSPTLFAALVARWQKRVPFL
jgi:short-subunit dehydrogenase